MNIYKIIKEKSCTTNITAKNKDECLEKISYLLSLSAKDLDEQDIYTALLEREKLGSTGFEDGIAIPHAKIKGLREFIIGIAVSKKGVDFESIDGKKTRIIFSIIGPEEDAEGHLQLLAQISRISRNQEARKEILSAETPLAIKEAVIRFVSGTELIEEKGKSKLLIIVLYEKRFMEDILEIFLERGIRGVNVMESTGIKDQLSNIPLFSSFMDFLGERSDVGKTIMAVVPEEEVRSIIEEIEEITGNLDTHTGAMVIALDLYFKKGSLEII